MREYYSSHDIRYLYKSNLELNLKIIYFDCCASTSRDNLQIDIDIFQYLYFQFYDFLFFIFFSEIFLFLFWNSFLIQFFSSK